MNSKKVYMNRFHKLLCRHCALNVYGKCQYYLEPVQVCHCRFAVINKNKYNIEFAFDINDKLKSVKIVWK